MIPNSMPGGTAPQPNPTYPMARLQNSAYAAPLGYNQPSEVVGGYDSKVNPMTGEEVPETNFAGGGSVPRASGLASIVQSKGRGDDSVLVHMTPREVHGLQALAMAHGGSLTINPETGLYEAGFLSKLLPTLLGVGLSFIPGVGPLMAAGLVGAGETIRTGDLGKGLMAGLGAYGGAGLGTSLAGMGNIAATAGTEALKQTAGAELGKETILAAGKQAAEQGARSFGSNIVGGLKSIGDIGVGTAARGLGASMGTAGVAGLGMNLANAATPDYNPPDLSKTIDPSYYESYGYSPEQGRFLGGRWQPNYPGFPGYAEGGTVDQQQQPQDLKQYYQGLLSAPAAQPAPDPAFSNYLQSLNKFVTSPVAPPAPKTTGTSGTGAGTGGGAGGGTGGGAGGGAGTGTGPIDYGNFGDFMNGDYGDAGLYLSRLYGTGGGNDSRTWDAASGTFKPYSRPMPGATGTSGDTNPTQPPPTLPPPPDYSQYDFSGNYPDAASYGQFGDTFADQPPSPLGNEVKPLPYQPPAYDYAGGTPSYDMGNTPMYDLSSFTPSYDVQQPAYNPPAPSYEPPAPSYEPPAPSYTPPEPTQAYTPDYSAYDYSGMNYGDYGLGSLAPPDAYSYQPQQAYNPPAPAYTPPAYTPPAQPDVMQQVAQQPDNYQVDYPAAARAGMSGKNYTSDFFGYGDESSNIFGFAGGGATQYAAAGRLLRGPGDGMSDDIKANISGQQEARLADGEFVIPADVVSHLGNGSSEAGSRKLYAMMKKVRKARTGKAEQAPQVNVDKYLPK